MSTDYERIRQENIERYGWDTAVLDLLGHLYSEPTHFIFELIQNAEDAEATELTFELFHDRLQVRHDGRLFTEADVRGVCGVGKTSKSSDLTKIGKFGIGFKSVYAYTKSPHIYSGEENFRIEKYVQPHQVPPLDGMSATETLFVFPFDRDDPAAATAVVEISEALHNIEPTTLLFLRNIERIRVQQPQAASTEIERVAAAGSARSSRQVVLSSGHRDDQEWLAWERQLPDHQDLRVEVAFRVATRQRKQWLVKAEKSPLVVFFPTAHETFLGFLVQGPYRTTPARDNIPEHDSWNQSLVRETAVLLADVLRELRDDGLLTVDVLQAMPIDEARFQSGTMFRPLFDSVRDSIVQDKLVPITGGGYGSADGLKLARGAGLRELLPPELLGGLYGSSASISFAADSITEDRTPILWQYLREKIGVDEVTPEAVVTRLAAGFLEARSDEWTGQFYAFLHQNPALWRAKKAWYEKPGPARAKPIIRLEDGSHVPPFNADGLPSAYLPGHAETEFPTVRRAIAGIPEARQFLEALKFTEPDVIAEVLDKVLPRYASLDIQHLDRAQHEADLIRIARALAEVSVDRRQHLLERLRRASFLLGENDVTGEQRLMTPTALYRRTPDLEIYLDGSPDAWFLREDCQPWSGALSTLGVREEPVVRARAADSHGNVAVSNHPGLHIRGLYRFDPDADIDGLEFALRNPNVARSNYVWNKLLSPNHHLIVGVVEKSGRQEFINSTREDKTSPIGSIAAAESWLPGRDGAFHRPAGLQADDLPAEYKRDDVLAKALGILQPVVEEASRQLGLPSDVLRGLSEHPDLVEELQQKLKERATGPSAEADLDAEADSDFTEVTGPGPSEQINYLKALEDAFSRPQKPTRETEDTSSSTGIVSNLEFRRSRVQEAITEDKAAEPPRHERFKRVARRLWESKDNSVRQFLIEQYVGRCQICGETFTKRDSTPYFEGLYLVSRTQARWIDRPGNVICLCATCCAKFQYGTVVADDIATQVKERRTHRGDACLTLQLCGDHVTIRFTEKHLLDLQEIIAAALP